jgi:hypothetical protein
MLLGVTYARRPKWPVVLVPVITIFDSFCSGQPKDWFLHPEDGYLVLIETVYGSG